MSFKVKLFLFLSVIALVAVGAFVVSSSDAQAQPMEFQTANMQVFGDPDTLVAGAATLTRSRKGISYRIYTTELEPGHAYTIWTVIFNRPQNCTDGCDGPDLSDVTVRGSVVFGGSYIAGANGTGNFNDSLDKGLPPAGIQVNVPAGTANGLINPMKAEVHLVLRTHGEPIAGQANIQLSTFEPCAACANVQFAVFPAS